MVEAEEKTDAPELVEQLDLLLEGQAETNRMLRSTLFATRVVAVAAAIATVFWVFWLALLLFGLSVGVSSD